MQPAFRRQRNARRGRDEDEASVLIARIVGRIEPSPDKRIENRADRNQPLAKQFVRQPECRQHQKQIILGDAQLDVLTGRRKFPVEHRMPAGLHAAIVEALAEEDSATIDPPAQSGGDRYVRRGRHDTIGERPVVSGESKQKSTEALLC